MSFYGNTVNGFFQFDKIYTSRKAMDAAAATDEVFLNRYVIVKYDENDPDSDGGTDFDEYGRFYDSTIWKKVVNDSSVKYELVVDLNPALYWHTF